MSLLLLFHGSGTAPSVIVTGAISSSPSVRYYRADPAPGIADDPTVRYFGDEPSPGLAVRPTPATSRPLTGITPLGYSNQVLGGVDPATVEGLLGRSFHGLRQNQDISVTGWSVASSEYDLGRTTTYRSIQISTGTWANVTSGASDANLTAIATNLMALSTKFNPTNPAIICFHHEQTLAANDVFGTAQDYINAYRHVRNLWDAMGATVTTKTGAANGGPIKMSYVGWNRMFINGAVDSPPAGKSVSDYDPDLGSSPAPAGTSYYELGGSDVYNSILAPGTLKYGTNAATMLDGIRSYFAGRGKDWMIGEMGCEDGATSQDHTNKAAWIDSLRQYLVACGGTTPGVCRALLLTIKASAENYNVDSSAESSAAFQRLGAEGYFS